jgi:hypothetical protein
VGEAGTHGVQAELFLGQQRGRRGADQLTVGDVQADQFLHGPAVQRLVVRFEGHQVVRPQALQPVGQPADKAPPAPPHDHHAEQLLLHRQVALDLDAERRAGEEVGEEQAEQPVPVP